MPVAAKSTAPSARPDLIPGLRAGRLGRPELGGVLPNTLAAITAVCIVAPECIAFAQLAGIPPERGLIAAPVLILAYAVVGATRLLYVTPLAATALLTAVTVSDLDIEPQQRAAATAAVALAAGLILLITGTLRCGFLVHFLRPEAVSGFLFGLALVVIVRELGVATETDLGDGSAAARTLRLLEQTSHWHFTSLAFTGLAFALLLSLERWRPAIPSVLVVLAASWALTVVAHLDDRGLAVVGPIPATLPSLSIPDLPYAQWENLIGGALGLALICFVLSYGVSSRVSEPSDLPINANREMIGLGVSNLLAGLVGGLAGAGSPEASPAARALGASRRWSTVAAAGLLLLLAGWGTVVFERLPEAALAAVVIAAIRGFTSPAPFVASWKHDRTGFAVAVSAAAGVVVLGLLPGLLIAVSLSFVLFIATASQLHVSELGQLDGSTTYLALERFPNLTRHDGVIILRPDGELFFFNADRFVTTVQAAVMNRRPAPRTVLLDLGASFHLDQPTVAALTRLRRLLSEKQIALHFLHLFLAAADTVSASALADVRTHKDIQTAVRSLSEP